MKLCVSIGFKTGGTGEEEEATKEVKEKSEKEGTIKKAFHFVEEKLGLRPPSSQVDFNVFESNAHLVKLDGAGSLLTGRQCVPETRLKRMRSSHLDCNKNCLSKKIIIK